MKVNFIKSIIVAGTLATSMLSATALAAGNSTYSLQQSGNTISVYETSSVPINTVEADFSYADSQSAVQSISVAPGGTFTTCPSASSASIVCTALGGNVTGTNLVATLTINLKGGVSAANVTATMLNSSAIYASVGNADTLDHSSLPSATYSYTTPAQTQQSGGKGSGVAGSTGSGASGISTNTSKNSPTAKNSTSGSVLGASAGNSNSTAASQNGTKATSSKKTPAASPAVAATSSNTWIWIDTIFAITAIAAGIVWLFRGRLPFSLSGLTSRA